MTTKGDQLRQIMEDVKLKHITPIINYAKEFIDNSKEIIRAAQTMKSHVESNDFYDSEDIDMFLEVLPEYNGVKISKGNEYKDYIKTHHKTYFLHFSWD